MARFPDLLETEITRLKKERANTVRHKAEVVERCDSHIALIDERLELATRLSDAYARSYPKHRVGSTIAYDALVAPENHTPSSVQPQPALPIATPGERTGGMAITDKAHVVAENHGAPPAQAQTAGPTSMPAELTGSSGIREIEYVTPEKGFSATKLTWSDIEATEIPSTVNGHRLRPSSKKAKIIRAVTAYLRMQKWAPRWELAEFLRKFNLIGSDISEEAYLSVILSEAPDLLKAVRTERSRRKGWTLWELWREEKEKL